MKKIISMFLAGILGAVGVAEAGDFGPFGTETVKDNVPPTMLEDIDLTIHGKPMAVGDCVALYRTNDLALCGLGKVTSYNGTPNLTVSVNLKTGTTVHFKVWQAATDIVYDCDTDCDYTIPETDDGFVAGVVLTVTPKVYTVKFDKNGGTGKMDDQKFTEGVEQALTENAFTKSGYLFVGWKDQDENEYEDGEAIVATSDLTLTAQWEAIVVSCDPGSAEYRWRATGDDLFAGSFDLTCNTDWRADASDPWIVLFGTEGNGDGRIEYSLTTNSDTKGRNGTITITSTADANKKTTFTIRQGGRPSGPTPVIENGVLVSIDMEEYADCAIPDTVTTIGANAFAGIEEVYSIRIPATVTEIGDGAFAGCANLTNVVFDGNAPETGDGIFESTPEELVVTVRNDKTGWPPEGSKWPADDASSRTVVVLKNYIVSFDWNGWEDGPAIEDIIVEPGESLRLSKYLAYEFWSTDVSLRVKGNEGIRLGYWLEGWNESGLYADGRIDWWSDYIPQGTVTLRAIWVANNYTFKFNANGGKPTSQDVFQYYGSKWGKVTEPTLANAVFDGWWTEKSGGERVDLGDVCLIVGNKKSATTLYAHWRKMFKATVKDGNVSNDGESYAANITVLSGTELYLEAADKSDKNMEFCKWTVSPATANLGDGFNPRDPNASFAMPDVAVAFTANYVAAPGYVEVSTYEVNNTANEDDDPQGIEWSDDGKVWTPVGDGNAYPVKTGKSVAIQFRSTDPRWTVPAKVTCQVVEGESTQIEVAATRVTIVDVAAECEQFGASGTVSMNPKNGQVLPGKPVALSAKPGKDTVFAYWLVDGEKVGYAASYKYEPSMDSTVTAVFRLKSSVADPVLDGGSVVQSQNSMVGVAFEMSVPLEDAAYPAKFTVSKLPAGLKIDSASGVISGVPAKAGKYSVAITAAGGQSGKAKSSVTLDIDIAELPLWAQGTFTGYVGEAYDDDGDISGFDGFESTGFATMTVASGGKVSGKVTLDGVNWAFSAASYDVTSVTDAEDDDACVFVVMADAKAGKVVKPIALEVRCSGIVESLVNAVAVGEFCGGSAKLWRGMWKDKTTAAAAKRVIEDWQGVYTMSLFADMGCGSGYLSLAVGKDGNVKATGKLADGTSASVASPLMYDVDTGWFAMLYAAPSAYKGGAFALTVGFSEPHGGLENAIGVSQWMSRNAEATGEYGEGFDSHVEFAGAYYNKLSTLYTYYNSLTFCLDDTPMLPYTYKETDLDGDGKKVIDYTEEEASAQNLSDQEGLTVKVAENGGLVVAKATKPVQDKETKEWSYNGANDGALSLSFAQATGIFKGSYTFWFDYESAYDYIKDSATLSHTSKKVNFEGIMVQGADSLNGFYLWETTSSYQDPKTEREKTYKYKKSYPVILEAE